MKSWLYKSPCINMPGNKESSKTIKKPEKEWAQSIARRSYSQRLLTGDNLLLSAIFSGFSQKTGSLTPAVRSYGLGTVGTQRLQCQ